MTDDAKNKSDKVYDISYRSSQFHCSKIYLRKSHVWEQALKLESNFLIYNLNVDLSSNVDDKKNM